MQLSIIRYLAYVENIAAITIINKKIIVMKILLHDIQKLNNIKT